MGNRTRRAVDEDVFAWAVIGIIFAALMLSLWGALFWQSMH
jgi:hypothetical protein